MNDIVIKFPVHSRWVYALCAITPANWEFIFCFQVLAHQKSISNVSESLLFCSENFEQHVQISQANFGIVWGQDLSPIGMLVVEGWRMRRNDIICNHHAVCNTQCLCQSNTSRHARIWELIRVTSLPRRSMTASQTIKHQWCLECVQSPQEQSRGPLGRGHSTTTIMSHFQIFLYFQWAHFPDFPVLAQDCPVLQRKTKKNATLCNHNFGQNPMDAQKMMTGKCIIAYAKKVFQVKIDLLLSKFSDQIPSMYTVIPREGQLVGQKGDQIYTKFILLPGNIWNSLPFQMWSFLCANSRQVPGWVRMVVNWSQFSRVWVTLFPFPVAGRGESCRRGMPHPQLRLRYRPDHWCLPKICWIGRTRKRKHFCYIGQASALDRSVCFANAMVVAWGAWSGNIYNGVGCVNVWYCCEITSKPSQINGTALWLGHAQISEPLPMGPENIVHFFLQNQTVPEAPPTYMGGGQWTFGTGYWDENITLFCYKFPVHLQLL